MTQEIRFRVGVDGAQQAQAQLAGVSQSLDKVSASTKLSSREARVLRGEMLDAFGALTGSSGLTEAAQRISSVSLAFGGLGNAVRGIGALLTPVSLLIGGVVAAMGAIGLAAYKGVEGVYALQRTLSLTGNFAGLTATRFEEMTRAVSASTKSGLGPARETLLALAGSGRLAGDALRYTAEVAERISTATGEAAGDVAKRLLSLTDDAARGAAQLNRQYNFLTVEQFKSIRALQEQGRTQEAVALTMQTLNDKLGDQTQNLNPLQREWRALGVSINEAWEAFKRFVSGAGPSLADQLSAVSSGIASLESEIADRAAAGDTKRVAALEAVLSKQRERQGILQSEDRLTRSAADAQSRSAQSNQAAIDKLLGSTKKASDAYANLRDQIAKVAQQQEAELEGGGQISDARKLQIDLIANLVKASDELTFAQRRLIATEIAGRVEMQQRIELQKQELQDAQKIAEARSAARRKEEDAIRQYEQGLIDAAAGSLKAVNDRIQSLEDEERAVELARGANVSLAEAVEQLAIARLREKAAALNPGDRLDEVNREIAARERLLLIVQGTELRKAQDDSAKAMREAFEREYDRISDGLADALIAGGKSFAEYIKGLFRNLVLRPILDPIVRPVAGAIASLTGGSAAFAAEGGTGAPGALGGLSSATSLYSAGQQMWAGFSSGFSNVAATAQGAAVQSGLASYGGYSANAAAIETQAGLTGYYGSGSGAAVGANAGGSASAYGTAASYAAGIAVGHYGGRAISGGYSTGGSGNANVNAGTAIGAVVGSIVPGIGTAIGAAVGGIIGGLVNRLFGRRAPEVESQFLTGSISGSGDFSGSRETNVLEKGGLFRSDRRSQQFEAITGDLDKALDEGASKLVDLAKTYGAALGLPVESLAGVTQTIRVKVTESDEENRRAIADALGAYATTLLEEFAPALETLRKAGESTAQVIERVGGNLVQVNELFDLLGLKALETSVVGGAAATQLSDLFGGLANLGQVAGQYYATYYTDAERAQKATEQLTAQFAGLNQTLPKTREELRARVEAEDLTTESGRRTFAALLQLSGAFDNLQTALGDTAEKADEAAVAIEGARRVRDAIDANIGNFLSPAQQRRFEAGRISEDLAGIGLNVSIDQLLGFSRQQIFDFAKSFVALSNVSAEAKVTLIDAAGSLARLVEAAEEAARASAINELRTQLDAIEREFGDLSVLDSIETVSQRFQRATGELADLERGFGELMGTIAKSVQETLAELLAGQSRLVDFRSGLADTIEETRLRTLQPDARIASLRSREASLFAQIGTASDPVAVAQRLQAIILQRIREEATLRQATLEREFDLSQKARDVQIDALRSQIDGFTRLRDLAREMGQFTNSLRFSDLSPLSFGDQLGTARELFESTLTKAKAGDPFAVSNLQGNARAYLDEARAYFASSAGYAEIFARVTGALDSIQGGDLDPQLATLQGQLDQLQSLNQTVIDTSAEELAALTRLDSVLASREAANATEIAAQTELAREQIGVLRDEVLPELRAQLTQAAARHSEIRRDLDRIAEAAEAELELARDEVGAP